eukprot:TRINITY_DN44608_c0_g1_i1.p1 TRINITY_DN44608_c0_g1~~TRINITY_DN44608_c0_g1_i1.p1  ORF type:complete len:290 (+),score=62.60 TRINITY_DN44608_c0_g1_i1:52-870(+)
MAALLRRAGALPCDLAAKGGSGGLLLFVRHMDKQVALDVDMNGTVADLKQAAVDAGIVADRARCVVRFGLLELHADDAIADTGITSEAVVELVTEDRLRWHEGPHSCPDDDVLRYLTKCSAQAGCGCKGGAFLSPSKDFPGYTKGALTWSIRVIESNTNSAFGVAYPPGIKKTQHFNSGKGGNGEFCWMWYAGGSFYHMSRSKTVVLEEGRSGVLKAGCVLTFELDCDNHTLRGSLDGVPAQEPLCTDLPDIPLLPYVELQTEAEMCELLLQ